MNPQELYENLKPFVNNCSMEQSWYGTIISVEKNGKTYEISGNDKGVLLIFSEEYDKKIKLCSLNKGANFCALFVLEYILSQEIYDLENRLGIANP